ncbi:MAG: 1-acyl-sn-glycerol-3-phosphate acyltransferase [Acidobacteria bacterium]|nr:1-acyl-sn-glycerol-3-phosphate acyltransferase [Acidobacteriota bacterium]MBI3426756.1 1-acyl-sn-glycerol-3-phosphate acyltransferase [Acidobacteriota bacterium]
MGKLRYYWTLFVGGLLLIVLGLPVITIGHILRVFFGREDFAHPYAKLGCRILLRAAGVRVHVTGLENLDPNQNYMFAANHQSNIDPPLLFAYLGHDVGFLAKKELTRIPIMKQGFPLAHVIPIDRSSREQAITSTRQAAEKLRQGYSIMVHPEGTRSFDGRVLDFKKGVFYMALAAGVPIVPVAVNDTRLVMRKGMHTCYPGDVYMEILPPVSTAGYTEDTVQQLIERVRQPIVERVRTD